MISRQVNDCPAAVHGYHGLTDRWGICPWCRRKIGAVQPQPPARPHRESAIVCAWRRHYDPDWGGGQWDDDPW